jgi:hypothetical protein
MSSKGPGKSVPLDADMEVGGETTSSSSSSAAATSSAAPVAGSKWAWATASRAMPAMPAKFSGLDAMSIKKREQLFLYHAYHSIGGAHKAAAKA